jgi:diguanylate cyclase (GGDEF)-like protein/PAS domain S-box-containing protein
MINITKRILFQALECGPLATVIVDATQQSLPIAYVNPAFQALTGYDATSMIGFALKDLVANGEMPAVDDVSSGIWTADGRQRLRQSWRVKDGQLVPVEIYVAPLYESPGHPSYWLLTQVEEGAADNVVSQDKKSLRIALSDAHRQLNYLQNMDPATGIPNRKAFNAALQRDWAIASREQWRLGVIMFQVDAFDEYVNLFGRHSTNSVLRKIGHAIAGSLRRGGDLSARWDKDRFAVLVGGTDEDKALLLAERIKAKVRKLCIHHPRCLERFISVSFGLVSVVPKRDEGPEWLIEQAESRLHAGRDGSAKKRSKRAASR